jgi:hypothetical protein
MKNTNALLILLAGIGSWILLPFILGLVAWLWGNAELKNTYDDSDRTMIQIGRILGMINVILSVIGICFGLLFVFGLLGVIGISAAGR